MAVGKITVIIVFLLIGWPLHLFAQTLTEYQAKFQEYQNIEVALRNQVALYNSKYEEFEKSLTRSNKMFTGFKEEMENVSQVVNFFRVVSFELFICRVLM